MKTVIANLKLYLPNRYFWPTYFGGTVLLYFIIVFTKYQIQNQNVIIGSYVVLPFFVGFAAALMQIDILTKPFSFCLPKHKQKIKKVLLILGILSCLVVAIIVVFFILSLQWNKLIIPVIFFASMFFYWLGVEACFFIRWISALIFPLIFVLFSYRYPYELLGEFIVDHPVLVIGIGLLSSVFAWWLLHSFNLARRFCAIPLLMGILDFYNKEKIEKYAKYKQTNKKEKLSMPIKPSVERFFLNGMKKHDFYSVGRYIWGNLYVYTFPITNYKPAFFFFFPFLICFYSYFRSFSVIFILMLIIFITAIWPISLYSSMLLANGRKERFNSTLVISIAASVLLIIMLIISYLISWFVEPYMPTFTLSQFTLVFSSISFKFCFIPLFIVPFVFTFKVVFHKRHSLMMFSIFILYMLFVTGTAIIGSYLKLGVEKAPDIFLNPVSILVYIFAGWIIYIAALRYICFSKSLV